MRRVVGLSLLLVGLVAGCDDASVNLVLTPTANLDTEAQVRAKVDSMRLVLDAPGGLYHPGDERVLEGGAIEIRDWDGDPTDLELVARIGMPSGRLPRVRVNRGGLPDVPLDVQVVGYPSSIEANPEVLASGSLSGVRIGNARSELSMPFDLAAFARPPRVSEVATQSASCSEVRIVVRFERAIEPATLLGPGSVVILPSQAPAGVSVDAVGREATIVVFPASFPETQQRFSLEVRPTVLGTDGAPLDQVPTVDGAQAFRADFPIPCHPVGATP